MEDYYLTLGVESSATFNDIKRAYYKLALHCHPDKSKALDASEKFESINRAYKILSDSYSRALYDDFTYKNKSAQSNYSTRAEPTWKKSYQKSYQANYKPYTVKEDKEELIFLKILKFIPVRIYVLLFILAVVGFQNLYKKAVILPFLSVPCEATIVNKYTNSRMRGDNLEYISAVQATYSYQLKEYDAFFYISTNNKEKAINTTNLLPEIGTTILLHINKNNPEEYDWPGMLE